jgi:chemotaxis protein MotB
MSEAHQASSEGGAPEYMVSYADMLTIMLSFFIVLYATTGTTSDGKDKGEKAGKGAAASQNPTGPHEGAGPKEGPGGKEGVGPREKEGALTDKENPTPDDLQQKHLEKVFESLYHRFGPDWTLSNCWLGGPPELRNIKLAALKRDSGGKDAVKGRRGLAGDDPFRARGPRPGDNMLVAGRIYFDEFSAEPQETQVPKLRRAVDELAGKIQKVEIRGHTSPRAFPANSPYHDHWELAFDRCRKVKDFLVASGIDPQRIRLSVAADNEPAEVIDDTLSAERNSRVEIRWLNEYLKTPSGILEKGSKPGAARK